MLKRRYVNEAERKKQEKPFEPHRGLNAGVALSKEMVSQDKRREILMWDYILFI